MAGTRLTKRLIDALEATGADYVAWDSEVIGFGVRVRPSGAKSFILFYRAGSGRTAPKRKMTLGAMGKLTVEEARKLARQTVGRVANGADPAAEKAEDRQTPNVAELATLFLSDHVDAKRKASTANHYRDILNRIVVPAIGTTKADKVSHAALARLHLKCKDTPYQANRILSIIGSMFTFAAKRGLVPDGFNPAKGIERYPEQGRERFISMDELERLGNTIRQAESEGLDWGIDETKPTSKHVPKDNRRTVIGPHAAGALRLYLFTGCRLREILRLRWEEIDLDRGLIFLPDSKTGKKTVILNAPALEVLSSLPRIGEYVIAGDHPDKPRSDLKRPWAAVSKAAGLEGFRIHDFRHSFASFGAGSGMGLPIIGKLLGHKNAITTARYAHLDADPLRQASERIGSTIESRFSRKDVGVVIPFKQGLT